MSITPFHVQYGYRCGKSVEFATFELAFAFYLGYSATTGERERPGYNDGPRLVNVDNIDGAEDSSAAAQHGLTAEQWEQVEAVG